MKNLRSYVMVGVVCALCALGCKKKASEPAAGSGSAGSGSAMAEGSSSGSAMAGSGSAMAGSGSGSAMAGSGSSAAAETGPAADAEGKRSWACPKTCKLALKCKSAAFKNEKECDQDCTSLSKDKDGRYARGSIEGAGFYTCIAKAKDCAGIKKCDHHGK